MTEAGFALLKYVLIAIIGIVISLYGAINTNRRFRIHDNNIGKISPYEYIKDLLINTFYCVILMFGLAVSEIGIFFVYLITR